MAVVHVRVKVNNPKVEKWERYKVKIYDGDHLFADSEHIKALRIYHSKEVERIEIEDAGDK